MAKAADALSAMAVGEAVLAALAMADALPVAGQEGRRVRGEATRPPSGGLRGDPRFVGGELAGGLAATAEGAGSGGSLLRRPAQAGDVLAEALAVPGAAALLPVGAGGRRELGAHASRGDLDCSSERSLSPAGAFSLPSAASGGRSVRGELVPRAPSEAAAPALDLGGRVGSADWERLRVGADKW